MLDKSNRNKFLPKLFSLILLFAALFSCSKGKKFYFYNTEVVCPNGMTVLVKYARLEEVRAAIIKADYDKKFYRTSEAYTIVRLPKNRSFRIEKLPPEEAIKCSLREIEREVVDKTYADYF